MNVVVATLCDQLCPCAYPKNMVLCRTPHFFVKPTFCMGLFVRLTPIYMYLLLLTCAMNCARFVCMCVCVCDEWVHTQKPHPAGLPIFSAHHATWCIIHTTINNTTTWRIIWTCTTDRVVDRGERNIWTCACITHYMCNGFRQNNNWLQKHAVFWVVVFAPLAQQFDFFFVRPFVPTPPTSTILLFFCNNFFLFINPIQFCGDSQCWALIALEVHPFPRLSPTVYSIVLNLQLVPWLNLARQLMTSFTRQTRATSRNIWSMKTTSGNRDDITKTCHNCI